MRGLLTGVHSTAATGSFKELPRLVIEQDQHCTGCRKSVVWRPGDLAPLPVMPLGPQLYFSPH